MQLDESALRKILVKDLMDLFIRVGIIAYIVVLCMRVFAPFAGLIIWALILAVALYPLQLKLAKRLRGRQGLSATLLVLAGVVLIGVPTLMLAVPLADSIHDAYAAYENNVFSIQRPDASVAEWPLVGEKIYQIWNQAAADLPALINDMRPQLQSIAKTILSTVAGTLGGVLLFMGSMVIAGIMMAYGEAGKRAMKNILVRFSGEKKGLQLQHLSTATIRSVANGVIGIAVIQSIIFGIGFTMAGIPGAGVLALMILVLAIAQLPAAIISLPVIVYLWWGGDASIMMNLVYTAYFVVAGTVDNILKPFLLGLGVEAPMPVILLGALGGMIAAGFIGMFIGAVVLAVGYQIFMDWVGETDDATESI